MALGSNLSSEKKEKREKERKEELGVEVFICIAMTADEKEPIWKQNTALISIEHTSAPSVPLPHPTPFQGFLLSTVPALHWRPLGVQDLCSAHTGGRTNFSISETPAAKAKKKPLRP